MKNSKLSAVRRQAAMRISGGKIRFDLEEIASDFFFTPKYSEKSARISLAQLTELPPPVEGGN